MKEKISILGAGESGTGAALLAIQQGFDVFVSDMGRIKARYEKTLKDNHIDYETGKHSEIRILEADEIIKSPGIPENAPLIKKAHDLGVPVISEIEFAARYAEGTIIGITGSNGKSTTTTMTWQILKNAGLNVCMAGNIGRSFAEAVSTGNYDHYVLELSSFQLDGIDDFKPDIAVMMNITPDHLDRYNYNFTNYIYSKFNIAINQGAGDYFVYCQDDEVVSSHLELLPAQVNIIPFSIRETLEEGAFIENNKLIIQSKKKHFEMSIYELAAKGNHNLYNAMAAGIATRVLDIRKDIVRESLMDFKNLEHRLEFTAIINGIEFINDSKATNVNSTWYALETMDKPIVWIAGGVDKGNDYSLLTEMVSKKVKSIICMGVDNRKLHEAFSRHVDLLINTSDMEEAVKMAYHMGDKGDCVLLSPACASFDLFEDYEDRGRKFKKSVKSL